MTLSGEDAKVLDFSRNVSSPASLVLDDPPPEADETEGNELKAAETSSQHEEKMEIDEKPTPKISSASKSLNLAPFAKETAAPPKDDSPPAQSRIDGCI